MKTAMTILSQIGGNKFIAMTGARDILGGDNSLAFRFGGGLCRATNKATHCRITLESNDTYTVRFLSVRGAKIRDISEHAMIYADRLAPLFTEQTGLDVSL